MQIDRRDRRNGHASSQDHIVIDLEMPKKSRLVMPPPSSSSSSSLTPLTPATPPPSSNSVSGGVNFIEHTVSKMDTLAGVAIKYGVEVADIKRMNGLVTDLQMFALKSLQIPLPGRHPPSPVLSNGSVTPGESSSDQTHCRRARSEVLESLQSLKFGSPQRNVSPAMSSLQGYYRLKPRKPTEEGTEMSVYSTGRAHYLEDGPSSERPSLSDPLSRHRKSRSLMDLAEEVPVAEVGNGEGEKMNKSVRRRQKAETEINMPSKEGNGVGSWFSAIAGKGLALRPKSTNRIAIAADGGDAGRLNPVLVGIGDALPVNFFDGVRKSSSTSNLQDQESNNGSSIWSTSKWNLKPDLQAFSAATLARPIFDGLPKPKSGRRSSKAALD